MQGGIDHLKIQLMRDRLSINNIHDIQPNLQCKVGQIIYKVGQISLAFTIVSRCITICNVSWDRSSEDTKYILDKICNARWDRLSKRWDRLTFTIVSLYNASGDRFSKVGQITIYCSYTMHQNLQCKVGQIICKLGLVKSAMQGGIDHYKQEFIHYTA